jgi:iron complex transport system substrate-binding protein
MTRLDLLNVLGLLLSLTASAYGGTTGTGRGLPNLERSAQLAAHLEVEALPDGRPALRDAGDRLIPLVPYQRIASATLIADRVLADLCDPTRIAAFSRYGAESGHDAPRLQGKPTIGARASVEEVLAVKPDLLLVNNLVDPGYTARLREHGVVVFDLGHMRGLATLLPNIEAIGLLIGQAERARAYAHALEARMTRLARDVPESKRPRAAYLAVYADKLYGGAARTSYHDVLVHAGLIDAAAQAGLSGWPELTAEQVLSLRPEVLLTKPGMGAVLCRHAGLSELRPCRGTGRLIELDGVLLDDPGPAMLEATEALYEAVWGTGRH